MDPGIADPPAARFDETILGYLLRYIRYAAVALWATFGAPWLFLRWKLADPEKPGAQPAAQPKPTLKPAQQ